MSRTEPEDFAVAASETNGDSQPAEHPAGGDRFGDVAAALRGLRFGQVTVTVQDGVIVQIDRTERRRFGRPAG